MHEYYIKLAKIFKDNFVPVANNKDYWKNGECSFFCENSKSCKVRVGNTPIYTSWPGDINTKIMVIGEAPSGSGNNNGGMISGFLKTAKESKKSPLYIVKNFCQKNYGQIPYFTDYCKCGVEKQISKEDLKLRFNNCFKKFLTKEIKAVKPEIIFVLGNSAYYQLMENFGVIKKVCNGNIKIKKLLHYSKRACLPLSPEDKMNIIWKYQAGFKDYNLSDLSFFKNIKG
jgi:uracil-DNA glycosylase